MKIPMGYEARQCMLADSQYIDLGPMNTSLVPAQTSVPNHLMTYCRQLADVHYERKLNKMYVHMLESFLSYEPWKATPPFPWYMAQIHASAGGVTNRGQGGWVPMNMQLPNSLSDRMKLAVDDANAQGYVPATRAKLSMRMFIYTAVVWWTTEVYKREGGPGLIPE
jgi:hypothetical protein